MMQTQLQRSTITLKGSAQIVTQYFEYAVQSILFQRGVYPSESFKQKKEYNIQLWVSKDDGLLNYLRTVLEQTRSWMESGKLRQLVLVITEADSQKVLERWTFDVETNQEHLDGGKPPEKAESEIKSEIAGILRQICASVSFLPLLETRCSIDILAYTHNVDEVPTEWEDSDARTIENAEIVNLRAFSTKVHNVKTMVAYKSSDDVL
uniref:HORMA domain-containing protein n=1 Tax=Polytomella parva TaxID=51329 RepID=A0A7S0VA79_9CHLO|mmetsp:Transcript_28888/g.53076  ORF Transcript_28888/g.53076 Transcript_28888/m.53076 type:complete len:207 (+) Transcript_28888:53-673(+)|eukprot:CAMPEP_0175074690 /NCGR_PEP_ID=MMETSP0052_2-20121109/21473_1 /TAXON_ID=51329 ORGANISM="Polytomella parva, Strain SAG 63-3" /NCGR_SAMPLE_ID=MMETSP0052_2 /ASSEMBLY_ACC=CAM_ASM_000194 /LENGTH=206 /DNA_ID=CAMNT_0016343069 /DNA_START=1 /DNA_END=621 /DNA_ORIENTATION=+